MRSHISTTLLALLIAAIMADSSRAEPGIAWQHDLDAAKQQAAAEGKLVLVHFWTPSCGPCRLLEQTVFNQPSVAQVVSTSYVPVKLNANEFAATATQMGITRVPTDVVMTPEGQLVTKFVSQQSPMAYITQVNTVAKEHRTAQGRSFPTVDNPGAVSQVNPVFGAHTPVSTPPERIVRQDPPVEPAANPYTSQAPAVQPTVASRPAPPIADNRYTLQEPSVSPRADQQQPVTHGLAGVNTHVTAPAVAAESASPANRSNAPMNTTPDTTDQLVAQPQPPTIQLPPGSPPLGFDGYCPVSMKREWQWKKGDVRWGAVHRDRTYLFASQDARDEFLKPGMADQFSPVLGGIDPVLAIDQQQNVAGSRQFAVEYRNQFYLFSSEETLRQFWSAADRYATGVYQAMNPAGSPSYR